MDDSMDCLQPVAPSRIRFGGVVFDAMDLDQAVAALASRPGTAPFAYMSTPNADFIYWARKLPDFKAALNGAWLSTSDSRILQRVARMRGVSLPFAPGSYIVRDLFEQHIIDPNDPLTVIGGTPEMVEILAARYELTNIRQHIPPMGFFRDQQAVSDAIAYVVANPARFTFISMGPPHSDLLAALIAQHGGATGIGLNVGSSLGTLTGLNARTPDWMENNGLVWLYRLVREPRRLWRRYLGTSLKGLLIAMRLGQT